MSVGLMREVSELGTTTISLPDVGSTIAKRLLGVATGQSPPSGGWEGAGGGPIPSCSNGCATGGSPSSPRSNAGGACRLGVNCDGDSSPSWGVPGDSATFAAPSLSLFVLPFVLRRALFVGVVDKAAFAPPLAAVVAATLGDGAGEGCTDSDFDFCFCGVFHIMSSSSPPDSATTSGWPSAHAVKSWISGGFSFDPNSSAARLKPSKSSRL
mmetsp:Transcript_7887/g.19540  ORF Transcript_7887/g.19540 Transcript_7887/m.19540 type:complete len:211 (-) Transcript_7887:402-1034(-)